MDYSIEKVFVLGLVTTMLGLTLREDGLSGVERIGRTK